MAQHLKPMALTPKAKQMHFAEGQFPSASHSLFHWIFPFPMPYLSSHHYLHVCFECGNQILLEKNLDLEAVAGHTVNTFGSTVFPTRHKEHMNSLYLTLYTICSLALRKHDFMFLL